MWGVLAAWFRVPEEPPRLPSVAGEPVRSFRPETRDLAEKLEKEGDRLAAVVARTPMFRLKHRWDIRRIIAALAARAC